MTLASTLRENKAVHAVAGAGDLVVEKVREVPEQLDRARRDAERYRGDARRNVDRYRAQVAEMVEKYRDEARETVGRYRGEARERVEKLSDRVEVRELPGAAVAYMSTVGGRTAELFDELAERGRKVVNRTATGVAEQADQVTAGGSTRRTSTARRTGASSRRTT